jgi:DNA-directed RNA polymerase I, II, and III subunit RPABC2
MSDNEYDNSESEDSDNEDSDNEVKSNIPMITKYGINIYDAGGDDVEIDDADAEIDDIDAEIDDIDAEGDVNVDKDDDADMDGGGDSEIEEDDDTSSEHSKAEESDIEEGEIGESSKNIKSNKPKKKQLLVQEEDEEEDEYDENYLQKFDSDITKNYVNDFHPECLNHNYDEIAKLSIIIKNSEGIIIDPLHRTIPYLTKYERARILGQRAKQIEIGAKPLVKVPENIIDSYIIAELELREKKIPFIIRRPIPGGSCEYWNIKDLEIIAF